MLLVPVHAYCSRLVCSLFVSHRRNPDFTHFPYTTLFRSILLFVAGEHQNSESVAPLATPVPSATGILGATAPPVPTNPPISDGYRIQIPRLAIDLPIAEGDIERDVVVQQTPENFAFHLPGA